MGMPLLGLLIFATLIVMPVWLFARMARVHETRPVPIRVNPVHRAPWDADGAYRRDRR